MATLLHSLLVDLGRRADCVLREMRAIKGLHDLFERHRDSAIVRLERAREAVNLMLGDEDLSNPYLEPNLFMDYKRLSELVLSIEESSLLVLKRGSDEDRYLTCLTEQICREVGYTDQPPLCGALSFQYFQALLDMDIIMAPQTQGYELLSLPDLYHELAHFVVLRQRNRFEFLPLTEIHGHFANAIRKAKQGGSPQSSIDSIRDNLAYWTGNWHIEFACDMIATYWCGPPYGWANLRLSASTRGDLFEDQYTHPADEARKVGIDFMLELIGATDEANKINEGWKDLKRLSRSSEPPGYGRRYPKSLLKKFAQRIFDSCEETSFQNFRQQMKAVDSTVIDVVVETWDQFVNDPSAFPSFESATVARLKKAIG